MQTTLKKGPRMISLVVLTRLLNKAQISAGSKNEVLEVIARQRNRPLYKKGVLVKLKRKQKAKIEQILSRDGRCGVVVQKGGKRIAVMGANAVHFKNFHFENADIRNKANEIRLKELGTVIKCNDPTHQHNGVSAISAPEN